MSETCLVYYWYKNDRCPEAWRDLENPVIPAIATVRGFNRRVPIYVLDASDRANLWGDFPARLGFRVVPTRHDFPEVRPPDVGHYSFQCLAKVWDVWHFSREVPERHVHFVDVDIFWRADPLSATTVPDRCVYHPRNVGYYHFDRDSAASREWFPWYIDLMRRSVRERVLREAMMRNYPMRGYHDESAFRYARRYHREVVDRCVAYLPDSENYFLTEAGRADPAARNYHFVRHFAGSDRGMYAYYVRDFFEAISRVLSPGEIEMIFRHPTLPAGIIEFPAIWKFLPTKKVIRKLHL